ncbi:hypothetical protein GCM10023107_73360 [Actinoplanes octamycinicus]|nr:hypothetical protein Aoc01nite_91020 [Actinoplanes octamycinicus]
MQPYPCSRAGRRRPAGLVAVVMLLAVLAASALFSAPSAHHAAGSHSHSHTEVTSTGTVCADQPAAGTHSSTHEHRHGNDWTPNLGQRARSIGQAALVTTFAVDVAACRGVTALPAGPVAADPDLSLLGVLRV